VAKFSKSEVSTFRLRATVDQLGRSFRTREVSEHPDMRRALARFENDPQFHQVIGIALSDRADQLGIVCVDDASNATWERLGEP